VFFVVNASGAFWAFHSVTTSQMMHDLDKCHTTRHCSNQKTIYWPHSATPDNQTS